MLENFISIIYYLYLRKSIIMGLGSELLAAEYCVPAIMCIIWSSIYRQKLFCGTPGWGMILNKTFFSDFYTF